MTFDVQEKQKKVNDQVQSSQSHQYIPSVQDETDLEKECIIAATALRAVDKVSPAEAMDLHNQVFNNITTVFIAVSGHLIEYSKLKECCQLIIYDNQRVCHWYDTVKNVAFLRIVLFKCVTRASLLSGTIFYATKTKHISTKSAKCWWEISTTTNKKKN